MRRRSGGREPSDSRGPRAEKHPVHPVSFPDRPGPPRHRRRDRIVQHPPPGHQALPDPLRHPSTGAHPGAWGRQEEDPGVVLVPSRPQWVPSGSDRFPPIDPGTPGQGDDAKHVGPLPQSGEKPAGVGQRSGDLHGEGLQNLGEREDARGGPGQDATHPFQPGIHGMFPFLGSRCGEPPRGVPVRSPGGPSHGGGECSTGKGAIPWPGRTKSIARPVGCRHCRGVFAEGARSHPSIPTAAPCRSLQGGPS